MNIWMYIGQSGITAMNIGQYQMNLQLLLIGFDVICSLYSSISSYVFIFHFLIIIIILSFYFFDEKNFNFAYICIPSIQVLLNNDMLFCVSLYQKDKEFRVFFNIIDLAFI